LPATSQLIVLVIDDVESHAALIARVITKVGYLVDIAYSGEDGLAKFQDRKYDLVITDVFMKGMGGINAIINMRQLRPEVPIIAVSAGFADMSAAAALQTAVKVGADAIMPKPFPLAELRLAMIRLLERGRPRT
jgi:CheY-like chemotaxis protein